MERIYAPRVEIIGARSPLANAPDRTGLAAVVIDDLPGDEAGFLGGQEGDQRSGIGWFADPAESK
jgi:hypothetical protein